MATTTFTNGVTLTDAGWFNDVDALVYQSVFDKGSDIASATTTNLGGTDGTYHDITGTTTITGFGTSSEGMLKILKFEGALTLTHNATSLILPGAANITTADGDVGIFISEGSGNWRCLSYMRSATVPPLSGTYTPTLSAGVNVAASTMRLTSYDRVGNDVHVFGNVDIDPTAAAPTATSFEIDLPVASNIGNVWELSGTFVEGSNYDTGIIYGSAANNTATFQYNATGAANQTLFFQFSYRVI